MCVRVCVLAHACMYACGCAHVLFYFVLFVFKIEKEHETGWIGWGKVWEEMRWGGKKNMIKIY